MTSPPSPEKRPRIIHPVTPGQIERVGLLLHGERWQSALADDLGVSRRTVFYWLEGESVMPADLGPRLCRLLRRRRRDLSLALKQILRRIDY